jgi:tetratricopeptide (TPR) repeat protein
VAPVDPAMQIERARAFIVAGRDLLGRKTIADMERAIDCFDGAVREAPTSPGAKSFLAMALMGRDLLGSDGRRPARALDLAREAVKLGPDDPMTHRSLCALAASVGRRTEAIEHGLRAIELGDRSGRAFGQLAYALRISGRPDQAIRWYLIAKAKNQQPADFDALLGDCWADLARDADAGTSYEWAATFLPDQPDGWLGLARLKLLARDFDAARQLCRSQILHYPDAPSANQFAAQVDFFDRKFDAAFEQYTGLQHNDRLGGGRDGAYGAVDYRSAVARIKIERGENNEARQLLQEVVATTERQLVSTPDAAEQLYRLAAAESMAGQADKAVADFKRAVAAGWIDYRSTRLDPRFDAIAAHPEFESTLTELAARVADLASQLRVNAP